MTPRAYSYIRFSSPEQERGDSLRRQVQASQRYAEEHGLVLDDSLRLTDRGLSAFRGAHRTRGALGGFLRLVQQGEITNGSLLLVENLDRLSREQVLDALNQFTSIIRAGIRVVTLQDGMEYSEESINANFGQLLMSIVYMSRAHEESQSKSKRLREAWVSKRERAKNGDRKLTGRCPAWLKLSKDKKSFTVLPERAEVIRRIFEIKLAGKGSGLIEQELNRLDVWKPENGWRKSYIDKLLHNNRALIGEYQPHKKIGGKRVPEGEPLPDYFPPVIDRELFDRVQAVIQQNRETKGHTGGRNGSIANLFGHLAVCGKCGAPMAYIDKGPKPKGGQYLLCDRARRGLGCSREAVRYDELEPLILDYCKGLNAADILPGNGERQSELSALRNLLEATEGELVQVERQTNNLLDSIAGTEDKALRKALEVRASALLARQAALKERKASLKVDLERLVNSAQETEQRLQSVRELVERMDEAEGEERVDLRLGLRSQLRRLLERLEVKHGVRPDGRPWRGYTLRFKDGTSRRLVLSREGALWLGEETNESGRSISISFDGKGRVIGVDADYLEAEAARLERRRKVNAEIAERLNRSSRNDTKGLNSL